MSYDTQTATDTALGLEVSGAWATYWVAMLRVITGWWFFHAGFTKLLEDGLAFDPSWYLQGMSGTTIGPLGSFLMGYTDVIGAMVVVFETLIGLALIAGLLTRLAAFGGVMFMTMFWIGNGEFAHSVVNVDLMGLLLFVTLIVFAAGRYYGLDAIVEQTDFVKKRPRLKYFLG